MHDQTAREQKYDESKFADGKEAIRKKLKECHN